MKHKVTVASSLSATSSDALKYGNPVRRHQYTSEMNFWWIILMGGQTKQLQIHLSVLDLFVDLFSNHRWPRFGIRL